MISVMATKMFSRSPSGWAQLIPYTNSPWFRRKYFDCLFGILPRMIAWFEWNEAKWNGMDHDMKLIEWNEMKWNEMKWMKEWMGQ